MFSCPRLPLISFSSYPHWRQASLVLDVRCQSGSWCGNQAENGGNERDGVVIVPISCELQRNSVHKLECAVYTEYWLRYCHSARCWLRKKQQSRLPVLSFGQLPSAGWIDRCMLQIRFRSCFLGTEADCHDSLEQVSTSNE